MTPERLELVDIGKTFGSVIAVDRVNLAVAPGEFFTLLGPSGSGKTTILRMVAGFEAPTRGEIKLNGTNVKSLPPGKRDIGVVFQNYALFPHMTVEDNVAYALKLRRMGRAERLAKARRVLALVQLDGYGSRYPRQLSGGQQQRAAVARALAFDPALLLMDEPLGALDRALRTDLEQELRRIHQELGTTILYVTHDQEEALAMSDRVGVMRSGRLEQVGMAVDLYERPANEFVARFFGECNVVPVTVQRPAGREATTVVGGEAIVLPSTAATAGAGVLVMRPERFRLSEAPGDLRLRANLTGTLYLGETVRLTLDHRDYGQLVVRLPPARARDLRDGQEVDLFIAPADCVVVPLDEAHAS